MTGSVLTCQLLVATGQAQPKLVIFHWIKALSLFFPVILTVPTQLPAFPDSLNFPCRVSPVVQPSVWGAGIVIVPVNGGLPYPKTVSTELSVLLPKQILFKFAIFF